MANTENPNQQHNVLQCVPLAQEFYQIVITEHPNHLENPNYPIEVIIENPNQWQDPHYCAPLLQESYQKAITEIPNQREDPYHCLPIIVCHYHYGILVQQGSTRISKYRKCRFIRPEVMNEKIRFQTTSSQENFKNDQNFSCIRIERNLILLPPKQPGRMYGYAGTSCQ